LIEILSASLKKKGASTIWDGKDLDRISQLGLIPESSLLKHLLKSATRPKAKVVSEKLYQALIEIIDATSKKGQASTKRMGCTYNL
jgi:hypothetical protein